MKAYVCVIFSFAFFLRIPLCNFVVSYICIASFVNQVGAGKKGKNYFFESCTRNINLSLFTHDTDVAKIKKD